jgi:hypothetical protein
MKNVKPTTDNGSMIRGGLLAHFRLSGVRFALAGSVVRPLRLAAGQEPGSITMMGGSTHEVPLCPVR